MTPRIDLLYFEGCPHVGEARQRVSDALATLGAARAWTEWDVTHAHTPSKYRQYGSPTVLVDGRDVAGGARGTGAGCVVGGAPSLALIVAALQGVRR